MDAIVTAGGIPQPEDPLYTYTQGISKALLDMAGKPMIQWVLDALSGSEKIEHILIVGLEPDSGVTCAKPTIHILNQGSMLDNVRTGIDKMIEIHPDAEMMLMVSSDIPAITSEMVDWTIDTALETQDDIYYNVISRETMEARYPGSNRSYIKLKDVDVCGGDMNVVRASVAQGNDELWKRLIDARKNALKQAALIGYGTLLLILMRQLSLEKTARRASKSLKLNGRAILCPYAEIAMDVDKPHQLEILQEDLKHRATT
jgi:GTP:adenosylcobinamide-phosphate guanylyltransferase